MKSVKSELQESLRARYLEKIKGLILITAPKQHVMKSQKYVKQNHIVARSGCFVNLHECERQKPEQRGLQVAWGLQTSLIHLPRVCQVSRVWDSSRCENLPRKSYQHADHIHSEMGRKKVRRAKPGDLQNERASFDVCLHSFECW